MWRAHAWIVATLAITACSGASEPTDVLSPATCGDGHVDDGEDCDDGNASSGDGCSSTCRDENSAGLPVLEVSWQVSTLANNAVGCMPMAKARVRVDPASSGSPVVRDFDCAAMMGGIAVKPGDYEVRVDIVDGANHVQISSLPEDVTVDDTGGSAATQMFVDAGYFRLAWQVITTQAATCVDAGVVEVDLVAIDVDSDEHRSTFDCNDGGGVSEPLLGGPAPYMVHLEALDALHKLVGMSQVAMKTIGGNNAITDLNQIAIPIAPAASAQW
jgi:cysteine-rich repeat protein